MKKNIHNIIYFVIAACMMMAMAGCISDDTETMPNTKSDGMHLRVGVIMPGYSISTRATGQVGGDGTLEAANFQILCFDADGKYLGMGRNITTQPSGSGTGTIDAEMPGLTTRFHIFCNANLTEKAEWAGMDEAKLVRQFVSRYDTHKVTVLWGRHVENNADAMKAWIKGGNTIYLLRDRAKVTVVNNDPLISDIKIALAGGYTSGMMVPYKDGFPGVNGVDNSWISTLNYLTLPSKHEQMDPEESFFANEAYAFEHPNTGSSALALLRAILKTTYTNGDVRYHMILLQNSRYVNYKIQRNHEYRINVETMKETLGSETLAEALDEFAIPSNNTLVAVDDIVPEVSDGNKTLSIDGGTYKVYNEGAATTQTVTFTYKGDPGIKTNDFNLELMEDNGIMTGEPSITFDNKTEKGTITFSLAQIADTLKHGVLRLTDTKNGLSRNIQLFSIKKYNLGVDFPASISAADGTETELTITIPDNYPSKLLPLTIRIASNDVNPVGCGVEVGSTEDLAQWGGKDWNCWFIYTASTPGVHKLTMKNVRKATTGTTGRFFIKAEHFGPIIVKSFTYN